MATTNKSILDREKQTLSIALQEVRPSMDVKAKEQVAKRVKKSIRTIEMYLSGYVGEIETARVILEASRKNIIKREQQLAKAS